jgi:hypothetical protein
MFCIVLIRKTILPWRLDAASSAEELLIIYETIRRHVPGNSDIQGNYERKICHVQYKVTRNNSSRYRVSRLQRLNTASGRGHAQQGLENLSFYKIAHTALMMMSIEVWYVRHIPVFKNKSCNYYNCTEFKREI